MLAALTQLPRENSLSLRVRHGVVSTFEVNGAKCLRVQLPFAVGISGTQAHTLKFGKHHTECVVEVGVEGVVVEHNHTWIGAYDVKGRGNYCSHIRTASV